MPLKDAFIAELKHESNLTSKILEKVPMDNKDWRPHEKSMSIGRLAMHIAETAKWASDIARIDDFDFMKDYDFNGSKASTSEELLATFQSHLDNAINDLSR